MWDFCSFITLVTSSNTPFRVSRVGLIPTTFIEIGVYTEIENERTTELSPTPLKNSLQYSVHAHDALTYIPRLKRAFLIIQNPNMEDFIRYQKTL